MIRLENELLKVRRTLPRQCCDCCCWPREARCCLMSNLRLLQLRGQTAKFASWLVQNSGLGSSYAQWRNMQDKCILAEDGIAVMHGCRWLWMSIVMRGVARSPWRGETTFPLRKLTTFFCSTATLKAQLLISISFSILHTLTLSLFCHC